MAKPTPEVLAKRKAKAKRSTMTNRIRVALANGNEKEGYRLAAILGEDIFLSRLPKEYQSPAEPWFVAKEEEINALASQAATPASNEPTDQIKAPSGANSIFSPEVEIIVNSKLVSEMEKEISVQEHRQDVESAIEAVCAPEEPHDPVTVGIGNSLVEAPAEPTICVRGWPVSVVGAEVWGTCRNPNLMVALLPDNRKVSMYQGRFRKFQLRTKVDLTLEQDFLDGVKQADPIYVASERRTNIW